MIRYSFSIPNTLVEKYNMQHMLKVMLAEKAVAWGVPEDVATNFSTDSDDYELKFANASDSQTRSPALTAARNASEKVVIKSLRSIYNTYLLNNPAVTAEELELLRINVIETGNRSLIDAPDFAPSVSFGTEDTSVLHVNYTTSSNSTKHQKPHGVGFCELVYKVGGDAPDAISACPGNKHISQSHEEIVFDPTQSGSKVYAFARWVNRNGKTGPWGGMFSAVIP